MIPDAISRVDRYASAIWSTSRRDEGTISATGARIVARAVVRLADVEAAAAVAAAREADAAEIARLRNDRDRAVSRGNQEIRLHDEQRALAESMLTEGWRASTLDRLAKVGSALSAMTAERDEQARVLEALRADRATFMGWRDGWIVATETLVGDLAKAEDALSAMTARAEAAERVVARVEEVASDLWRSTPCGCGHRADLHSGDGRESVCIGGLTICACTWSLSQIVRERLRTALLPPAPAAEEPGCACGDPEEHGPHEGGRVDRVPVPRPDDRCHVAPAAGEATT